MKNHRTKTSKPPVHAPVLSLSNDRRVGGAPDCWALYETPAKWIYCAIMHPDGDEYIVPIAASLLRDFKILAKRGDPSSIIGQLEILSGLANSSTADGSPEDIPPVPPEDYAEDILYLTPGRDQVWGTGTDVVGFKSANGIPYFIYQDFCIVCSTLAFCKAVQYFTVDEPAILETDFSSDGNPCFVATQGDTTITFHICEEELLPDFTQNENVLHVSPVAFIGRYNGKDISDAK